MTHQIIDGRYYLALRDPPVLVRVQPLAGFRSAVEAVRFLSALCSSSGAVKEHYVIVEAAQIVEEDDGTLRAGGAVVPRRAEKAA